MIYAVRGQQIFGVPTESVNGEYHIDINSLGYTVSDALDNVEAASVSTSAIDFNKIYNVKAFDKDGGEIAVSFDSATGIFAASAKPDSVKYYYVTGFNNVDMDVTLHAADSTEDITIGSSGGGCNSAFGGMALLALALILRKH